MIPLLFILYFFSKYFIMFYFASNFVLSVIIYIKASRNYFPHMKFTEQETKKFKADNPNADPKKRKQYFHEDFPSFCRIESNSVSLGWIYFGVLNYFWIKAFGGFLFLFLLWVRTIFYFRNRSIKSEFTKEDRERLMKIGEFYVGWMYKSMGIRVYETNLSEDTNIIKLYRKYLGDNYDPTQFKDKYTTVIANHISWADILYLKSKLGSSFISKDSVKKIPLVGYVSYAFKTLYINRQSKDSRIEILQSIAQRQKELIEGKSFFPMCMYPEGTTSNGRSIIQFKKGAFYGITPIKLFLLKVDNREGKFPLTAGGMDILTNMALSLTFFSNKLEAVELPVFAPNDYLFENFKHLGKDKPEIFAEACRHLMSEISGWPLSKANFETKLEYMSNIKRKVVKNT
jgi:1-acyl-sn-glycerol-3-phosphate acyltransferase